MLVGGDAAKAVRQAQKDNPSDPNNLDQLEAKLTGRDKQDGDTSPVVLVDEAVPALREILFQGEKKPLEVAALVQAMADQLPNGIMDGYRVLFEALFLDDTSESTTSGTTRENKQLHVLAEEKKLILAACGQDEMGEAVLLLALEHLAAISVPARLPEAALVMKLMYEYDIVSEDTFFAWSANTKASRKMGLTKEQAKEVREVVQPFLTWLEEAESDSEDEE